MAVNSMRDVAFGFSRWFHLPDSLEVGTVLEAGFIDPLHGTGFLKPRFIASVRVDGVTAFTYNVDSVGDFSSIETKMKKISLTLENKVHHIQFRLYTDFGHVLFVKFIIPTVNGVPVVRVDGRYGIGEFDGECILLDHLSSAERADFTKTFFNAKVLCY